MASRKRLKKTIHCISAQMLFACGMAYVESGKLTSELQEAIQDLYSLERDIVQRINHTEPGQVKLYYKKLREEFIAGIKRCYDVIAKA